MESPPKYIKQLRRIQSVEISHNTAYIQYYPSIWFWLIAPILIIFLSRSKREYIYTHATTYELIPLNNHLYHKIKHTTKSMGYTISIDTKFIDDFSTKIMQSFTNLSDIIHDIDPIKIPPPPTQTQRDNNPPPIT